MWGGLGNDIDSAFQWKDHKTYFFKGKGFWRFNDHLMEVAHEKPRSSAHTWMNCPKAKGTEDQETFDRKDVGRRERIMASGAQSVTTAQSLGVLLATLVLMGASRMLLHTDIQ